MPNDAPQEFENLYNKGKFEQALQCLIDSVTPPQFKKIIEQTFNKPIENIFPASFERKFTLFHQAFKGPWLSTNMDRFIEASFAGKANQITIVKGYKDPALVSDLNHSYGNQAIILGKKGKFDDAL